MTKVNVFEAKAKFAECLDRVARGERLVIYRYNTPVAELRPVETFRTEMRPIGPVEGRPTFDVPSTFFEPLDEEELRAWEGVSPAEPRPAAFPPHIPDTRAKVAEPAPGVRSRPRKGRRS